MITSLYNKILFYVAPLRLIKRYTSRYARRMYFIREYELGWRQIWRAEFFSDEKKRLREDIRREYDKTNEDLGASIQRLEVELKKEDPDKIIKENLEKIMEDKKKSISQFKEQIDNIDTEIKGDKEAIESLRITLPLLEKYISQ